MSILQKIIYNLALSPISAEIQMMKKQFGVIQLILMSDGNTVRKLKKVIERVFGVKQWLGNCIGEAKQTQLQVIHVRLGMIRNLTLMIGPQINSQTMDLIKIIVEIQEKVVIQFGALLLIHRHIGNIAIHCKKCQVISLNQVRNQHLNKRVKKLLQVSIRT